jgi:hypothetical protein
MMICKCVQGSKLLRFNQILYLFGLLAVNLQFTNYLSLCSGPPNHALKKEIVPRLNLVDDLSCILNKNINTTCKALVPFFMS